LGFRIFFEKNYNSQIYCGVSIFSLKKITTKMCSGVRIFTKIITKIDTIFVNENLNTQINLKIVIFFNEKITTPT